MAAFIFDSSLNNSQFYQPEYIQEFTANFLVHESSSCLDQSTKLTFSNTCNYDTISSVTNKITSTDSSSITDKVESTRAQIDNKRRRNKQGSSMNSAHSKNIREVKGKRQRKSGNSNMEKTLEDKKDDKKACEEAPSGYIHVRARRGQATDSHSLAERVRREKISEKMKILQALVPGCDKVTGKALMLDEIINYVQSLQHQVEFLSMKLASVNPMFYDFGVDLDSLMDINDQKLNVSAPPLPPPPPPSMQVPPPPPPPSMQVPCNPNNALMMTNNYSVMDNSSSLLFQHGYMQNTLPQLNGQLWCDMDDQRQKLINQFAFSNNLPLM